MSAAPGGRFCEACDKIVHDLSAMTETGARALLRSKSTDGLCIRYVYDPNRGAMFGGVPVDARIVAEHTLTKRLRARIALGVGAAAAVTGAILLEACGSADPGVYEATSDGGPDADGGPDGGDGGEHL